MKTQTKSSILLILVQNHLNLFANAAPQGFHFPLFPQIGSQDFLSEFTSQWANFFPHFQQSPSTRNRSPSQQNQQQAQQNQPQAQQNQQQAQQTNSASRNSNTPSNGAQSNTNSPTQSSSTSSPQTVQSNQSSAQQSPNSSSPSASSKQTSSSASGASSTGACSSITVRKEWRSMARADQKSYLSAVKCLLTKPSTLQPNSKLRLYDDFESVHDRSRPNVHWVAQFLPWHRHFIHLYEQALQSCGYNGGLPRWNWSLDAANMTASPVWSSDPEVGFGGNGMDFSNDQDGLGGGTVEDGAFANLQLLYPDTHLLERGFNSPPEFNQGGTLYGSQYFDDNAVNVVKSADNYMDFHVGLEGTNPSSPGPDSPGPHGTIHATIGGDMSPTSYAANDVIFFLHHANVDAIWWQWQQADPKSRTYAFSGNRVQGQDTTDATLNDRLAFLGYSPDLTVRQAMDTSAYPYCYRYE
ncbi:hypothetical protein DFH28DRAFT_1219089 [Melampsora americana]|nr:hypothetical protein DFH28DRAFT_1219089 [Melampsora americana]